MPLNEHLVELTAKSLIACRDWRAIADVSMNNSHVKLICPSIIKPAIYAGNKLAERVGFATMCVLKTKEVVENTASRSATIAASAGV